MAKVPIIHEPLGLIWLEQSIGDPCGSMWGYQMSRQHAVQQPICEFDGNFHGTDAARGLFIAERGHGEVDATVLAGSSSEADQVSSKPPCRDPEVEDDGRR
ncbi:MAG: hypothetical protein PHR15_04225 [Atopobiaceae bacterium]|nr:hypothetical protein [Atopobiaceae bacterium]MCH4213989.1 hypothetical protein [Atopobiaceae bacterium]MCH4276897.1 hypothetical protein [Atopobiaceae bacterium]MCI1226341.1 hypothetical protein [Atopobiaceae bacterium]MDD2587945.1 hypothetical protein [Atopobiaceae bacterium]